MEEGWDGEGIGRGPVAVAPRPMAIADDEGGALEGEVELPAAARAAPTPPASGDLPTLSPLGPLVDGWTGCCRANPSPKLLGLARWIVAEEGEEES